MKRLTIIAFIAALTTGAVVFTNAIGAKVNKFDADQVKEIQRIIHNYIVTNPNVLVEASQALQKQQQTKMAQKAKSAISMNAKKIFSNNISPSFGNKDAKIKVVEFLDYQCGHCKTMSSVVTDLLKSDPNVHFIVKELPIFGANSNYASRVAIAVAMQAPDKFQAFHNELLNEKKPLTKELVDELAKKSGFDMNKIKTDVEKDEVKNQIKENFKLAQEIGLQGTPAFIVGTADGAKAVYIPGATTKQRLETAIKEVSK